MLLVLNLPLVRVWVKLLRVPAPLLTAAILVFATLGVYSTGASVFELFVAYGFGLVGFALRRAGYPIAPLILGAVLGPLMEVQFRRALAFSEGDPTVFVTRPVSAIILLIAVACLILPVVLRKSAKIPAVVD
jgi:putative tricarboxylic transport membrane protein